MCPHRPIFPSRLQLSIGGISELNFRVRNGNGCTLTNKGTDCEKTRGFLHRSSDLVPSIEDWGTIRDSNPGPTD